MGAKDNGSSDDIIADINVTPFVDVVLVLLIIFMIAAPVVYQSAVRVQLPKVVNAEQMDHITLRFYMTADKRLTLEKDVITPEQVEQKVIAALKRDPMADAIVAADGALSHGDVMALIDRVKSAGLKQVAIGVDLANPAGATKTNTAPEKK